MGSEEESGKDWSELEEEAAQGKVEIFKIKIALESLNFSYKWLTSLARNFQCASGVKRIVLIK